MLKPLSYDPNGLLPGVILNKESGQFILYGQSCPEDPLGFYDIIFQWFEKYSHDPNDYTEFDIKLTYFNTASAKILLMILIKLEKLKDLGHTVKVRWFFEEEDEDLQEAGEEFETIVDIDFEIIPIKSNKENSNNDDFFNKFIDNIG